MSVVVVVPALSEGEQSNPPAVAGQVRAVEVAVSEGVGGGVHQPSHVIDDHEAQWDGPQDQAKAAAMHLCSFTKPVQAQSQGDL